MAYDNKDAGNGGGAPKKADVLIQSTQTIEAKQTEVVEQTKLAISRIDEAIQLCHKNSEEATYLLEHSQQMFDKLQEENSALKQELLYLAKQSENIYAGLAEKLNELEEEGRRNSRSSDVDAGKGYYELADKLALLFDQIADISSRLDALSAEAAKPATVVTAPTVDNRAVLDKLDQLTEYMRKTESAHSMLADRFEILSMRVEQFGFGSVKSQPVYPQPAPSYPVTMQSAEIDYDKLASKVADLLAVRDTVSPDYIASKVAEQIVLPESFGGEINTHKLAREVASLIDVSAPSDGARPVEVDEVALADRIAKKLNITAEAAPVEINEDSLAERIAEKLNVTAEVTPVEINEDSLADKIAQRLASAEQPAAEVVAEESVFDEDALVEKIVSRISETLSEIGVSGVNIDQEDLADDIALKVGSLKPEDFEIMVDDEGCDSISKSIVDKLDYNFISTLVADKIREVLDINAANAPDYEDMAERISEKITVAGINEDAIAEKAAAVLSNYLPEFDVDEIADKVTGAVIDVVSAIPHPTLDSETICNEITERLIEKQDENNYDIVIDDDGITRITAIVTEQVESHTAERLEKLEEGVEKLTEMLAPEEVVEDEALDEEEDVLPESFAQRFDKLEENIDKLTEMLSSGEFVEVGEERSEYEEVPVEELPEDIVQRFDRIEDSINKLAEMLTPEEVEEEFEEELTEDDMASLSEAIAEQVGKDVSSRFDKVDEDIAKIYDIVSNMVVEEDGEQALAEDTVDEEVVDDEYVADEEYTDMEVPEEEYRTISDMVSGLSSRFEEVEQKIDSLSELLTAEDTEEAQESEEEYEGEEEYPTEYSEDEYAKLSEMVTLRFDAVEQKIDNLTELMTGSDEDGEYDETDGEEIDIAEVVASEIERAVSARFDGLEERIAKIGAIVGGLALSGGSSTAADVGLYEQFDKVSEEIAKIAEYIEGEVPVVTNERIDKIAIEIERISQLVEGELSIETAARLDKLQEEVEKLSKNGVTVSVESDSERLERVEGGVDEIKEMLIGGVTVAPSEEESAVAQVAEVEEEEPEELVTVSEIVKPIQIEGGEDDGDFILSALDMDSFSEDERMPGELGDLEGVDFENMMKYNRSFIARIIQSDDDCKQYYGAVKHALLSYKKVNSNVAWSNERFNKGRETIARMKIRGKTLVVYLALDPNEYKTSVYHHADVSNNNSVPGTPMMIKVKSPLGVRKAIRLIDEMLAKRNGEKREVPERDYAAMYPYETIEELIEDGLVKDVRKK